MRKRDQASQRWLVACEGKVAVFYAWAVTWYGARAQGAVTFRSEVGRVTASPAPPTTNEELRRVHFATVAHQRRAH